MIASVIFDDMCLLGFDVGGDEEERRVDDSHHEVIKARILCCGHPPFKRENQAEDLDEI